MNRIISTDQELETLRDGTILLQPRDDGFNTPRHPDYWIVDGREGPGWIYSAQGGMGAYGGVSVVGFVVIYEPPVPEERTPDSYRYKFEHGTLADPHTPIKTEYSDLRSDVDDEMRHSAYWLPRPKITDQKTGEVICEAWVHP